MTDYNDGKWHGHNGEQCPVHLKTEVEVVYHGLEGRPAYRTQAAGDLNWLNSKLIIAFRVIKQHREPRDFWVVHRGNFSDLALSREQADAFIGSGDGEIIHVREVLE